MTINYFGAISEEPIVVLVPKRSLRLSVADKSYLYLDLLRPSRNNDRNLSPFHVLFELFLSNHLPERENRDVLLQFEGRTKRLTLKLSSFLIFFCRSFSNEGGAMRTT